MSLMAAKLYRKELVQRTKFNKIYSIRLVKRARKLVLTLHSLRLGPDLGDCATRVQVLDLISKP
jgi:hypothetical protein